MNESYRPSPRPRPGPPPKTAAGRRPGRLRRAWSDAAARVDEREAATRRARRRWEPPIDPSSWTGALITILVLDAVLWAVHIADTSATLHLSRYGIEARHVAGLRGVVLAPFVNDSARQLLSDSVPFVGVGWVVLLAGARVWAVVTLFVIVVGGLATWVIGPEHGTVAGVGGVFFGWLGYLIARAVFSRRIAWIVVAACVVGFFGALLYSLLPSLHSQQSWQLHLTGFLAGLAVGAILHPRGAQLRRFRRTAVQ